MTGITSNQNRPTEEGDDETAPLVIRKELEYFIVTKTKVVEDEILKTIFDSWYHGKLTYIRPRSRNRESKDIATALKTVLKVIQRFLFLFACGSLKRANRTMIEFS